MYKVCVAFILRVRRKRSFRQARENALSDEKALSQMFISAVEVVILLSALHHDIAVDECAEQKPEVILHYNAAKSAVGNLDHLCSIYTVKRKTRR